MLSMINVGNAANVERHLKQLAAKSGDQLSMALAERDASDMTPLCIAVKKGDFDLVKVLLSFDASVDSKMANSGKTVEMYAKELAENKAEEKSTVDGTQRKRIYALLKSRGRWQSNAEKTQGILFARSMKALEDAVKNIQGAAGKQGILFLGITGEGKSTLINYLYGLDYKTERLKGKGIKRVKLTSEQKEVAPIGDSTTSETLLPKVIELSGKDYVLIDLPGFEDTRGTAEEICAAASICMLTAQLSKIQAVLLVSSWKTLEDARMVNYRKAAHNVGAMISLNARAAENVVLAVTKPDSDTEIDDAKARLEELMSNEGGKVSDAKREDLNDDLWKKQCLLKVTHTVLSQKDSVILADVTKPALRDEIHRSLAHLRSKALSPEHYDFKNYSRYMNHFKSIVDAMIIHYNDLARQKNAQQKKIIRLQQDIKECDARIAEYKASIEKYEQQKSKPFDEAEFNKTIEAEKQKLKEMRTRLLKRDEEVKKAETELLVSQASLNGMEREGEKLIDTVTRGWTCEKTEDRTETEVEPTGQTFCVEGQRFQVVDIRKKHIPGVERTVSETVRYPSTIPIQRYVDNSQGGTFTATGFTPGSMVLEGVFKSAPGARGGVSVSIQLYGNVKDFPGTKERLNRLETEAKTAQTHLEEAKRDTITADDVNDATDTLRGLELNKIAAVGNHQRTSEICDMFITQLTPQLQAAQKARDGFQHEIAAEQAMSDDIQLQIEVNADLFDKLKEIIRIMNFRSEAMDAFMNLSNAAGDRLSSLSDSSSRAKTASAPIPPGSAASASRLSSISTSSSSPAKTVFGSRPTSAAGFSPTSSM